MAGAGEGIAHTEKQDFEWLINNRLMAMNEAEANRDWYRYFVYFRFVFYRILPFIRRKERRLLETDWQTFHKAKQKIELNENAEGTRKKQVEELMRNFVETHQASVFYAFGRAKLISIKEEGIIDWTTIDLDTVQKIVRGRGDITTEMAKRLND